MLPVVLCCSLKFYVVKGAQTEGAIERAGVPIESGKQLGSRCAVSVRPGPGRSGPARLSEEDQLSCAIGLQKAS